MLLLHIFRINFTRWPKLIEPVPDLSPASPRSSARLTPRLNSEAVLSKEASRINLLTSLAPRTSPIMPFETPLETGPCEIESTLVSRSRLENVELLLLLKLCCSCARQNMSLHVTSPQLKLFRIVELDVAGVDLFEGETSFSRPSGGIRSRFRDLFPFPVDDFRFDEFRRVKFSPSPSSRSSRPEI